MTYGRMRALLIQEAPALSLQRANEAINSALEDILNRYRWSGMEETRVLTTVTAYNTGTVAVTNGSADVVGTGTTWTTAMDRRQIRIGADAAQYEIRVATATTLALDRAYEGTTGTALAYAIRQRFLTFDESVRIVKNVVGPSWDLHPKPLEWLNQADPSRAVTGSPRFYIEEDRDTQQSREPVRIELHPVPELAETLTIRVRRRLFGFDGSNTGDDPPEWMPAGAVLDLARAKLLPGDVSRYQASAERLIQGMLAVEIQSHAPVVAPVMNLSRGRRLPAWPVSAGPRFDREE